MITGCGESHEPAPIESPILVMNSSFPVVSTESASWKFLSLPPMTTEQTEQPIRFQDLPPLQPHILTVEEAAKCQPFQYRWHREFEDLGVRARVVCHDYPCREECCGVCLRFFVETEGKWQPAYEYDIRSALHAFESFEVVRAKETPTNRSGHSEGRPMFFSCVNTPGASQSHLNYLLVSIDPKHETKLSVVPIERPTETLKSLLGTGQHSESDRTWIHFANGRFWFSFEIWNEGDRGNFPTGGGVAGSMKLVLDADGQPSRLVVADWKQYFDEPAPADE